MSLRLVLLFSFGGLVAGVALAIGLLDLYGLAKALDRQHAIASRSAAERAADEAEWAGELAEAFEGRIFGVEERLTAESLADYVRREGWDGILGPVLAEFAEEHDERLAALRLQTEKNFAMIRADSVRFYLSTSILFGLGGLGLGFLLASRISRPLEDLRAGVRRIGEGDFAVQVPERGTREVADLARSFNRLGGQLRDRLADLSEEAARREVYEREVRLVARLQEACLPAARPEQEDPRLRFGARLAPAREAAGDFYDFLRVDDHRFAVAVGDVSGKGLAAAFFMVRAKTLLDGAFQGGWGEPGALFTGMDRVLAEGNGECMFLTLFLAVLDVRDGTLVYANAGHPAARIAGDGEARSFGLCGDPPLGIGSGRTYRTGRDRLEPGQTLFLHTDGVSEQEDAAGRFYGEERLAALLGREAARVPGELVRIVEEDVRAFAGTAPQTDDLTLVALRWTG